MNFGKGKLSTKGTKGHEEKPKTKLTFENIFM